ncbi:MAG: hypothetical protein ABR589_12050 [Chthoniobacterales bacterium]
MSCTAHGELPDNATDRMSDDELRAYREERIAELRQRLSTLRPERTADGTLYSRVFFCTIYYTPKESGFTAERGFDATPVSARGLSGRKYPRDFLAAVKKEGFGRLIVPVNGRNYLQWQGDGRYGFAAAPLGRRGEVLQPRRSCAISTRNKFLRQHRAITIKSPTVNDETGSDGWYICDTGPGVHPLQIDLYWGEDEPRGAIGRQCARPAGTWMEYAFEVDVTAKE